MTVRLIEVTKCSPPTCPYCIPDATNANMNYCSHPKYTHDNITGSKTIRRVKTFPKSCPLKEKQEKGKCGE